EVRQTMERVRGLFSEPDFWLETLCELGGVLIEFDAADGGPADPALLVDALLDRCRNRVSYGHWQLIGAAISALSDRLPATRHQLATDTAAAVTLANRWIDQVDSLGDTAAPEDCLHRGRALAELSRLRARPDAAAWAELASGFEELGMSYNEAHARWRCAEALLAGVAGRTSN